MPAAAAVGRPAESIEMLIVVISLFFWSMLAKASRRRPWPTSIWRFHRGL